MDVVPLFLAWYRKSVQKVWENSHGGPETNDLLVLENSNSLL